MYTMVIHAVQTCNNRFRCYTKTRICILMNCHAIAKFNGGFRNYTKFTNHILWMVAELAPGMTPGRHTGR